MSVLSLPEVLLQAVNKIQSLQTIYKLLLNEVEADSPR